MSFPFTIPAGSPLEEIQSWKPEDVASFAWRAASGLKQQKLAEISDIDSSCVEALLAEPSVKGAIKTYQNIAELDPESFRKRLRPMVRLAAEREMERQRPCPRFIMFCMYCFEFSKKDPVEEAISALIKSLNKKRRKRRQIEKNKGRTSSLDPAVSFDLGATRAERFAERANATVRRLQAKFAARLAAHTLDPAGQAYLSRKAFELKKPKPKQTKTEPIEFKDTQPTNQTTPPTKNPIKKPQGP